MLYPVTPILFKLVSVSFCLVTVIVYVLIVVLSSAVTTTEKVFSPTSRTLLPSPVTLDVEAVASPVILILSTLYGTLTVYSVLLPSNVGVNVPLDTVKLFRLASLLDNLVTIIV